MQRIFVSSTFRDMNQERDALGQLVLPELNAIARSYGESISFCDLRWGINTAELESEAGSKKVLSVCLNEIDSCRPYMIVLLGQRYGWIPSEELIRQAVEDRQDFALDELEKSVTALEIEYGALNRPQQLARTLFYFRELEGQPPEEYLAESPRHTAKLNALKQRICKLSGGNVKTYRVRWDSASQSLQGMEEFAAAVIRDVSGLLHNQWQALSLLTPQEKDLRSQFEYARYKAAQFTGRSQLIAQLQDRLNTSPLLALQGATGSGKSTLMSRLALSLQDEGVEVLPIFCGSSSLCCTAMDVLRYIIDYLETRLSLPHFAESGKTGEAHWLERLAETVAMYEKNTDSSLCILVDAADQLAADELRDQLRFIPPNLSQRVRLVLSCLDSFPLPARIPLLPVGQLDDADRTGVIRGILAGMNRELDERVMEAMGQKESSGNPLYLSLLVQRLTMMDREDFAQINARGGQMDAITAWQLQLIDGCADSLQALSVQLLEEAARRVGGSLSIPAAGYLAVARYGLRESDLMALFQGQSPAWSSLDFARFLRYMGNFFFLRQDGRWDFTHKCFREGLLTRFDSSERHRNIYLHLLSLDENDPVRISEIVFHCIRCDDRRGFVSYATAIAENTPAAKAAAADAIAHSRLDGGAWLLQLLAQAEELGAGENLILFFRDSISVGFNGTYTDQKLKLLLLQEHLEFVRKYSRSHDTATVHKLLSNCASITAYAHMDLGSQADLDSALQLFREALTHGELHRDYLMDEGAEESAILEARRFIITRLQQLAHLHRRLRTPKALETAEKTMQLALKLFTELPGEEDTKLYLELHSTLAEIYFTRKHYLKAMTLFHKALDRARQRNSREDLSYILNRIFNCHLHAYQSYYKEPDVIPRNCFFSGSLDTSPMTPRQAYALLEESHQYTLQIAEETGTAAARRNLSIGYQDMARYYSQVNRGGDQTMCIQMFEKSLAITEQLAKELNTVETREDLYLTYYQMGRRWISTDRRKALRYFMKGMAVCEALSRELNTFQIRKHLANFYKVTAEILHGLSSEPADLKEAARLARAALDLKEEMFEILLSHDARRDVLSAYTFADLYSESAGETEIAAELRKRRDAFDARSKAILPANPFDF